MGIKISVQKNLINEEKKRYYTKKEKQVLDKAREDYYIIPKQQFKEWIQKAGYYTPDDILQFISKVQKATSGT